MVDVQDFGNNVSESNPDFFVQCERFAPSKVLGELAFEIAFLPVRADQQFTSEQMLRIAIERLVDPHDHVVVPTLIPERDRDRHVSERRRRVAFQTLQFQVNPRSRSPSASIKPP